MQAIINGNVEGFAGTLRSFCPLLATFLPFHTPAEIIPHPANGRTGPAKHSEAPGTLRFFTAKSLKTPAEAKKKPAKSAGHPGKGSINPREKGITSREGSENPRGKNFISREDVIFPADGILFCAKA